MVRVVRMSGLGFGEGEVEGYAADGGVVGIVLYSEDE